MKERLLRALARGLIITGFVVGGTLRAAYELPLATGWNLVSLPEQQTNTDIEFVTASIRGKFSAVWGYDSDQWSGYFPAQGASTLARMDAGRAYWIFMTQPGSLVGAGLRPASTLALTPGWNFVGHNAAVTKTPAEVYGTNSSVIEAVQSYEAGAWRIYVPGAPGNTLTLLAPGRGYWVRARAPSVANFGLTLNPRLRVLSDNALATVTQVSATSVTLASAQATGIAAGDVLAAGISARTPDGLLRRVAAVSASGILTTFTTTGAAFTDAVTDGVLGFSLPLADQSTVAALAADLGPGERAEIRMVERAALTGGGTFTLPAIVLTLNRDVLLNSAPVRVTGEIFFEPTLSLNFDISGLRVRSLRVVAQGRESLSLSFQASQSVSGSVTRKIFEKSLPNFTVNVGFLPIVITPKLSIPVTLSGTFGTTASASLRQDAVALVGFRYDGGYGFAPIRELQNTFTLSNTNTVTSSVSVKVGVSIALEAYGIAGPYAGVNAGLSLEAQTASNISTWGIYGVVGGEVGFEVGADLGFWKLETSLSYALPFEFVHHRLYPPSLGTAAGLVVSGNGALTGVTVSAAKNGRTVGAPTTTAANGAYSLSLPVESDYTLTFSRAGYATRTVSAVAVDNGATTNIPQVFMDLSNVAGTVRGTITNAYTGQLVRDALLTLRAGLRSSGAETAGIVATAVTDSSGRFEVRNLDPGYYTTVVSATGYINGTLVVLARGGVINDSQNGTISPVIDDRDWRVVLTWGASPWDLDSHLTGPLAGSTQRFHVYFSDRGNSSFSPYARLDVDEVYGYGPETITINRPLNGTYRYSVHDYSNSDLSVSSALALSGAQVRLYRGNSLVKTYAVPAQFGTLWTVFEIRNGTLTDINTMSYAGFSFGITAQADLQEDADPLRRWLELPGKPASDRRAP